MQGIKETIPCTTQEKIIITEESEPAKSFISDRFGKVERWWIYPDLATDIFPQYKSIQSTAQIDIKPPMSALLISFLAWSIWSALVSATNQTCRNVPGSPGFPTSAQWETLNNTVSGRLVKVVPFLDYCATIGGCTTEQFDNSTFRADVPGAMNYVKPLLWFLRSTKIHIPPS